MVKFKKKMEGMLYITHDASVPNESLVSAGAFLSEQCLDKRKKGGCYTFPWRKCSKQVIA